MYVCACMCVCVGGGGGVGGEGRGGERGSRRDEGLTGRLTQW